MSLAALPLLSFEAPSRLEDVCALLVREAEAGRPRPVLLAGGTDWYVEQHVAPPPPHGAPLPLVVDVSRLSELKGIHERHGLLRLGAGTTYLELRRSALVADRVPLLSAMARDVGALQIQARGTLGGNLASGSPAADGVTALAALDATLELTSARGVRSVPLADFYIAYRRNVLSPDELLTAIELRIPEPGAVWRWRKVGTRQAQAISKVALAAVAERRDDGLSRLGLGMASVTPVISFLPSVRTLGLALPLASLDDAALDAATDADISPIDDVRSTAAYRRHVARALVRGFFASLR